MKEIMTSEKLHSIYDNIFNDLSTTDLIELHNNSEIVSIDDFIYENNEYSVNEVLGDKTPYDTILTLQSSVYNLNDEYFWLNGYANLESSNHIEDMPIDEKQLRDYYFENPSKLKNTVCYEDFDDFFTALDLFESGDEYDTDDYDFLD